MEVILNDPFVLFCGGKSSGVQEIMNLLEQVAETSKPLLIVADQTYGRL